LRPAHCGCALPRYPFTLRLVACPLTRCPHTTHTAWFGSHTLALRLPFRTHSVWLDTLRSPTTTFTPFAVDGSSLPFHTAGYVTLRTPLTLHAVRFTLPVAFTLCWVRTLPRFRAFRTRLYAAPPLRAPNMHAVHPMPLPFPTQLLLVHVLPLLLGLAVRAGFAYAHASGSLHCATLARAGAPGVTADACTNALGWFSFSSLAKSGVTSWRRYTPSPTPACTHLPARQWTLVAAG